MKTLALSILFFLVLSCSNVTKQELQEFAHNAYFKADLDQSFEKLLEYYQSQKVLTFTGSTGGYTLYPPLSALVDTSVRYIYSFEAHPYHPTLSTKGELVLQRLGPTLTEPELLYYFKSQENALDFIENITKGIQEKPNVDNNSLADKSREIHYQLNNSASLFISLTPGLNPGYTVSIKYRHRT